MQGKTRVVTRFGILEPGLGKPEIQLLEDSTFHAAAPLVAAGYKTAVLNFANAFVPGGGVTRGAMAQEECLCRSSNLYRSLEGDYVRRHYYKWNQDNVDDLGSDRVLYSPFVTVYKTDETYPKDLPEEAWFSVDVISCAAPMADPWTRAHQMEKLYRLFCRRIRNILETAVRNGDEAIVLGAFGCGAFRNDPLLVAAAFHEVLIKEGYGGYFKKILFAIKKNNHSNTNLAAFRQVFETGTEL